MSEKTELMYYNRDGVYYCRATGEVCSKVTTHFDGYRKSIKYLAENKINLTLPQDARNLCITENCNLYRYIQDLKKTYQK